MFEPLPDKVVLFIFLHPEGSSARQFALCTEEVIPERTLTKWISWGKVVATRRATKLIIIAPDEMMRVATLAYNWATVESVSEVCNISRRILAKYVDAGHFGATRENVLGQLCIAKNWLDNPSSTLAIYRRLVRYNRKNNKGKCPAMEYELTCKMIATTLGVSEDLVAYWHQRKHLFAQRRGKYLIIRLSDFLDFARKVVNGEIILWRDTVDRLVQYLDGREEIPTAA